jgi:pimeloyl-ACP methyl ester carboxylesterase
MPLVQANNIEIYYEVQGEGEPLVLIPYLAADQACYAFQVADYARQFTCYTVDLRGAGGVLGLIQAPTQITFGRHDVATSTRFAGPLTEGIKNSELVVFEDCAHAPIYENVAEFNARTLAFLTRHSG